MEGEISNQNRSRHPYGYAGDGDPGMVGGGTYTAPGGNNRNDPNIQDYENIFGPAARDIKLDLQRNKRHARWHLPDALKGSNPYLADRIDGLITDTTASPFTTVLLPYKYIENVDAKLKWNVWSFDEGMASRVPYESAARTLTQTKRSYAGFTVRHGLAITMEHNFMMSEKGRQNFKDQLQQLVGSIQYTNDWDVHIALITAQSYAKERAERYYMSGKTNHQIIREYIDLFGFMSKNANAMDIMIEDAKAILATWGAAEPNFLLCNSKLTFQMTMIPEKTQYLTQGPDGVRRLKAGPNISTYRGLNIIHSRSFSIEEGAPPRDVLRRRVRVAEYYHIPWEEGNQDRFYGFYDESKDAWHKISWKKLLQMSKIPDDGSSAPGGSSGPDKGDDDEEDMYADMSRKEATEKSKTDSSSSHFEDRNSHHASDKSDIVIIRPNIEHNMLGIILGRGGLDELGATFWGQTELSCYDDSMHGIWGMSYKYNEKAIVTNNKNLVRLWDVAYDGYNGGKDCTHVDWTDQEEVDKFVQDHTYENNRPYEGPSMMVMSFPHLNEEESEPWPSPILFYDSESYLLFGFFWFGLHDHASCFFGLSLRGSGLTFLNEQRIH